MKQNEKENEVHPFASKLLAWHLDIDRKLPWKVDKNPYKIWLSEIIMQQTRVAQGTPYYLRFVEAYPTIVDLANAPEGDILRLWQGLGYYNRARNLHHTAKVVRDEYEGVFPTEYEEVLSLKGVGAYTAAAIMSFSYDAVYPVVDGNVIRVLSRYFGITDAVDKGSTMKIINELAKELISIDHPAAYNQAIMDFGSMVCSPKSPSCLTCPLIDSCAAFATKKVAEIPFKSKKIKKRNRYFNYFVLRSENHILLRQRTGKDIWQNLYEFPLQENEKKKLLTRNEISKYLQANFEIEGYELLKISEQKKHILSHQNLYLMFYIIDVDPDAFKLPKNIVQVASNEIDGYAFPIVIANFITYELIDLFNK